MALAPGSRIGPYEILSKIGAGGMGQVWKARDTRLDRVVAIKVSAEKFSERFGREARAVTALNHPHICTHYVGKIDRLFRLPLPMTVVGTGYEVSADGKSLLAPMPPEGEGSESHTVVQNWLDPNRRHVISSSHSHEHR